MSSASTPQTTGRWNAAAEIAGKKMAERLFTNKPGRGNARATERHLSEADVAGMLSAAFEMGADLAAETLKKEAQQ